MKDVLKKALDKLSVAADTIKNATPGYKAKAYDIKLEELRSLMFQSEQAVRAAKLALEEASGAVTIEKIPLSRKAGDGSMADLEETHESFGRIEVTKPTGHKRLVGTMTGAQPSYVSFKIYRSKRLINSNTHSEHYFHEGRPLVEFSMSVYQWAEMMSSMQGQGTCCTLDRVMGVQMDPVPEEVTTPLEEIVNNARKDLFDKDTDQVEKDFWSDVEALTSSVNELKLSKKAKDELVKKIKGLKKHTSAAKAAATWATTRFTEDTEEAISTAKVEIAAAIDNLATRRGLSAFKADMSLLEEGNSVFRNPILTEGQSSDEE